MDSKRRYGILGEVRLKQSYLYVYTRTGLDIVAWLWWGLEAYIEITRFGPLYHHVGWPLSFVPPTVDCRRWRHAHSYDRATGIRKVDSVLGMCDVREYRIGVRSRREYSCCPDANRNGQKLSEKNEGDQRVNLGLVEMELRPRRTNKRYDKY